MYMQLHVHVSATNPLCRFGCVDVLCGAVIAAKKIPAAPLWGDGDLSSR